jgi:RHS repeat-associated protein
MPFEAESGLGNFGARYYTWRFGRWLSADWSAVPVPVPYANLTNPQTLNLYAMVADDPESFADLDGHQSPDDAHLERPCIGGNGGPCEPISPDVIDQKDKVNASQAKANAQPPAQMSTWQFFKEEVKGFASVTVGPIVDAAVHPLDTLTSAASNLVEGVKDVVQDPKGTLTAAAGEAKDKAVQFGEKVASGDPRAIGQAAGLVVDAYVAARGVQGKEIQIGDDLRIAPAGNRTGGIGELPHYHRRIRGPGGKPVPGGGIGWHRPWESSSGRRF